MPHPLLAELTRARVVPVVRTKSTAHAATAVSWLRGAGLKVFEITMTVPDAPGLIRELAQEPGLLVGAGTVRDVAAARACLDAGAKFLVAPWVDPELSAITKEAGACLMLGAMTPTEVRAAVKAGTDVVKVFPASSAGGPAHIKALRSVFPEVSFCPTGGVDARNAPDYLAAGASFVGIGGKLVDEALVAKGDRAAIEAAAREALGIVQA